VPRYSVVVALTLESSPSAAALTAPLDLPARSVPEWVEALPAPRPAHRSRWLFLAVVDAAGAVLLVYLFAVAVLAGGTPIALLVRLLAWLTGAL
jgi:hypothetical protein